MAVEILGGGVHDHVEAMLERPLHPRAGEGVVGDGDDSMPLGQHADGLEIGQLQQRVGRRFDPEQPRLRPDGGLDLGDVAEIDKPEGESGRALAHALEQPVGAAVEIVHAEHVGAAVEEIEYCRRAREAGGEGEGGRAALEIGDAALIGHARRILRA
jgi:hypothetical protein